MKYMRVSVVTVFVNQYTNIIINYKLNNDVTVRVETKFIDA